MRPEYALVVAPFAGTMAAALVIVIAIPQPSVLLMMLPMMLVIYAHVALVCVPA